MLSFIVRLCNSFRREHGFAPNVLYLNAEHYEQLRSQLDESSDYEMLRARLGMDIMVSEDVLHPRVGWITGASRLAEAS